MKQPYITRRHQVETEGSGIGEQRLYRFPNGYGASVVQFYLHWEGVNLRRKVGSFGINDGKWELAVIVFPDGESDEFHLTYETPITPDVLGHLSETQVDDYLEQIAALPTVMQSKT